MSRDCSCGAAILAAGPPDLAIAERVVLWSLRVWGAARRAGAAPAKALANPLAAAASVRSAALLCAAFETLEQTVRRPLCFHGPACPGYAPDEQRLVAAFGLAQAAPHLAAALLEPLLDDPDAFLAMARAAAGALALDDLHLPIRLLDAGPVFPEMAQTPSLSLH